jgi:hypothetical protein
MQMNQKYEKAVAYALKPLEQRQVQMDYEGFFVSGRIEEVLMMCGREHFIYEQISNFGIALYVMGFFDAEDIMAMDDIEPDEAGIILSEYFTQIKEKDLPSTYNITKSKERYLLVIGNPLCPLHFAVLADMQSERPFFSKLRYFGSGFDSLKELCSDFLGEDGLGYDDIRYFKKNSTSTPKHPLSSKIYIVRNDS